MPELRGDERLLVIAAERSRVAGALLGLFVAAQVLFVLGRADRALLFWWRPDMRFLVLLYWARDLGAAAAAGFAAAALFRLVARRERLAEPLRPGVLCAGFAAAAAVGAAVRWVAPDLIPPAQWVDTFYEIAPVLRDPAGAPWIGSVSFPVAGAAEQISLLYARLAAAPLFVFGREATGLLAIAAVPGTLAPLAVGWLSAEAWGARAGLLAALLTALARWPILLSRWGFTAAAMVTLLAAGAAALLAALRTRRLAYALLSGAAFGLALHTHTSAYAVAGLVGLLALTLARERAARRLLAAAGIAALLAFAPFAWGFVKRPALLGGHVRDVHLGKEVRDVGVPQGRGIVGISARLAYNAGFYTGLLVGGSDPNARHAIPGAPVVSLLLCGAALLGIAAGVRDARRVPEQLLLVFGAGALLAGILSDPGAAPNSLRASALLVPTLAWAARGLLLSADALTLAVPASPTSFVALALAAVFAVETVPALAVWPFRPDVERALCVGETRAGRLVRAGGAVLLDPAAVRYPIVVETFASEPDARRPIRRLPLSPPASAGAGVSFWYVTDASGAALLARRTRVSRRIPLDRSGLVLVRAARVAPL